ncbi:hypothetical protein ACROYT_G012892 [Oculina patagonica]
MAAILFKLSVASMLYVMSYLAVYCCAAENKTGKQPSYIVRPPPFCYGGIPGMHGKPGSPEIPDPAGMHGRPGSPGAPGRDGRDGREGAKGDHGIPGKTGPQGSPGINGKDGSKGNSGAQGPPGQKGQRGESGTSGISGTPKAMSYKNWKECVWQDLNDAKDHGLIKDCVFTKNFTDTFLHVYWTGVLRIHGCDGCCKRWYFTFNGAEWQLPCQLTVLCTCGLERIKIYTVSAILKGTVTTSTKARCALDFVSEIVKVVEMPTPTQAGIQYPGSMLKKFLNLRLRSQDRTSIPA